MNETYQILSKDERTIQLNESVSAKKVYIDKRSAKNNIEGIPRKRVNFIDKRSAKHNPEGTPRKRSLDIRSAKNNPEGIPRKRAKEIPGKRISIISNNSGIIISNYG